MLDSPFTWVEFGIFLALVTLSFVLIFLTRQVSRVADLLEENLNNPAEEQS